MDDVQAKQYSEQLIGSEIGGWRILEYIDHGKSAVVFRAFKDEKVAALKVIGRDLEAKYGRENQQGRIELEAKLVGKTHPNLVTIYGSGRCTATDLLFVAMEFLPYKNLEYRIPTFPSDQIWPTIEKIASASEFLEQLDIVHRDIKPANIAVSDDFAIVKLLDLGICRPSAEDSGNGTGNHFIGTLRYSPPEFVWREEKRTTEGFRAITFYQLGAVLHDMIMRRRIFQSIDKPEAKLIEAVRNIEPALNPTEPLPRGLVRLAKSCLHKSPDVRLKVVKWSSFKRSAGQRDVGAIKEEMAMRQSHLESPHLVQAVPINVDNVRDELVAGLDFAIRDIVQVSGVFPSLTVDRHFISNDSLICASIRASAKHELQSPLMFALLMSLIDAASRTVSIKFLALLRGQESQLHYRDIASNCAALDSDLYTGPLDIAELKTALESVMLEKFMAATEFGPSANCRIL